MPASAFDPSGTFVDVLCGQPEQKYGVRVAPDMSMISALGRSDRSAREARSRPGNIRSSRLATIGASNRGDNSPTHGTSGSLVSSLLPNMSSAFLAGSLDERSFK